MWRRNSRPICCASACSHQVQPLGHSHWNHPDHTRRHIKIGQKRVIDDEHDTPVQPHFAAQPLLHTCHPGRQQLRQNQRHLKFANSCGVPHSKVSGRADTMFGLHVLTGLASGQGNCSKRVLLVAILLSFITTTQKNGGQLAAIFS